MGNEGLQLFISACLLLIGLVIIQILLKQWDKRAKAKEAAGAETAKPVAQKKKK